MLDFRIVVQLLDIRTMKYKNNYQQDVMMTEIKLLQYLYYIQVIMLHYQDVMYLVQIQLVSSYQYNETTTRIP